MNVSRRGRTTEWDDDDGMSELFSTFCTLLKITRERQNTNVTSTTAS